MNHNPTFAELSHPDRISDQRRDAALAAAESAPLDPANLDNLARHDGHSPMNHVLIPSEMTGTSAPIVVVTGNALPTKSHHGGATWACLVERLVNNTIEPGRDTLVIPDHGGWGFSAAAVARVMGFDSEVIAPEDCHPDLEGALASVGAKLTLAPVLEVVSVANSQSSPHVVLDLNLDPAAWRYHAEVTAMAIDDLAQRLHAEHVGRGSVDIFVAELGGAGILGAGARLATMHSSCQVLGVRTPDSPRVGLNDSVDSMKYVASVNENDCRRYLEFMREAADILVEEAFIPMEPLDDVIDVIGLTGMRNVFAASMLARHQSLDHTSLIVCASPGRELEHRPVPSNGPNFEFDEVTQLIAALHDGDISSVVSADSLLQEQNDVAHAHPAVQKTAPWTHRDADYWSRELRRTAEIDAAISRNR